MSRSLVARVLAAGRVAIGAALIAAPDRVTAGWVGPDGAAPGARVIARGQGIRDILLGLGALGVFGGARRGWTTAAIGADFVDLAAVLGAGDDIPPSGRLATAAVAGGAVLVGAWVVLSAE